MTEINIRKGDSLGTIRNGVHNYPCSIQAQDMNTAVILNQSSFNGVFQSNEWKGGGRYYPPIYPTGYHLPIQTLLPIAGLKQLSLGKTTENNQCANLHGVYSTQIQAAPIFSPPLVKLTPVKESLPVSAMELHHLNAQSLASTIQVPQFSTTLTQSQTRAYSYHVPLTPATSHLSSSAPGLIPQFSTISTQSHSVSRQGNHRPAAENVSGNLSYLIQNLEPQQNGTINIKSPFNSSAENNTKTPGGYRQSVAENVSGNLGFSIENLGARQNGTSINKSPPSSAVKLTELKNQNDAHLNNSEIKTLYEKQRNVSLTRKRSSSWPSGSGLSKKKFIDADGQTKDDQIVEEYKNLEMDVANILISDIPFPVISLGLSKAGKISVSSGGEEVYKQTEISPVGSGKMMQSTPNVWSGGIPDPNRQANMSPLGNGAMSAGSNEQGNVSPMGSEEIKEPEQQANRSKIWIEGTLVPNKQDILDNRSPVGNGEMRGSNQQAEMSTMGSGNMKEREQQDIRSSPWIEGMLVPNRQSRVASGVRLGPEKHSSDGNIHLDASLQFENEKENYSKNLINPSKVVFTCQQCVVTFESTEDLISHTASHTSNNFSFKCNVCTQVFRSTSGLQKHVEFHADHRNNFQCSFCFKAFPDRDNLEEHIIASHMSKRPHKCSYCPKAFRDPGSLQKHVRIHTGERPYKCTACEKSFAEYSSLRKHYRVHTGEQPYKCQYCPKAFSISGNLQRHILIHTGERPYKCSECSKTFNNPSHLRRHEKNLHSKLDGEK